MSWSSWLTSLQFPDDIEAVAEWEENGLYTGVVDYEVIEGDDSLGLFVFRDGILPEFAIPKDIIGKDETAGPYLVEGQIVVGDIFPFVGIHVNYVVGAIQSGDGLAGISDVKGDLVGHTGARPTFAHHVFQFVVDLKCVDVSVFRKAISHAGGGIASERTDFKDAFGP